MPRRPTLRGFTNALARDIARYPQRAEAERKRIIREQQRAIRQAARDQILEEKEKKKQYVEDRIQEVSDQNDDLNERIEELQSITEKVFITDSDAFFESLRPREMPPEFNPPAHLSNPTEAPKREPFLLNVKKPNWMASLFSKTKLRYKENLLKADEAFEAAFKEYAQAERERIIGLKKLEKKHEDMKLLFLEEIGIKNKKIDEFRQSYLEGDEEAVTEFYSFLLENSEYPEDFPQQYRISYRNNSKQLAIEYQFPSIDVVPKVKEYRHVKSKDIIEEKFRKPSEIKDIYQNIVTSISLRTLDEVFKADKENHIEIVIFNGYVKSIDLATGKDIQPFLISIRTTKERFLEIELSKVDKIACLRNLGAQVSPRPSEMLAIKPIIEFNMADKRFIDQEDILSSLDDRPNLMELNPFEFEHLVSNLFEKMGLETKLTRSTKDGGVDAVAFDKRPVIGGKVVIQAKRYSYVVGVSAVRDLYGTMMNEGANKGILVCTSNYGPDAYDFAKDKPIELIDGGGLLYLLDQVGIKAKIIFLHGV